VQAFYDALESGQAPEKVASLFAENAEWEIPGDAERVPWAGLRKGRAGVAEFLRQLRALTEPVSFDVHRLLAEDNTVVALGELATRVKATGRVIESAFAANITVENGLITRYQFLEDTWAVSEAVRST
jgi:ketosteroid isomerase-like protein